MWAELKMIVDCMTVDWLLVGDFNDIAYASEKKGGGGIPYAKIATFVQRINACQLIDLGDVGTRFTWRRALY